LASERELAPSARAITKAKLNIFRFILIPPDWCDGGSSGSSGLSSTKLHIAVALFSLPFRNAKD
jgi:hypothetical protein